MQRFRDQIDADAAGYAWLHKWIEDYPGIADSIEATNHEGNGRTVVAWLNNKPVAMFTVLRDQMNWSILIINYLDEDIE
jgi:hypothetical protein